MKQLFILFCSFFLIEAVAAQNKATEEVIQKISSKKNENEKIDVIMKLFFETSETDPLQTLKNQQKIFTFSQANNDRIAEALSLACIGHSYRSLGNNEKSLEYALSGYQIAQETRNKKLLAIIHNIIGVCYKDIANYPKAMEHFKRLIELCDEINYNQVKTWGLQNISEVYIASNKIDSALIYSLREYELLSRINYYEMVSYTYLDLGAIHGKLGNTTLARSYYDMAIQEGKKNRSPKQINWAYTSKAQYYYDIKETDSTIASAKKAIDAVNNTVFTNYSLKPAKLLLDIYRNRNIDSAFKYGEIYRIANDSLFNAKVIQQTQLMTFENEQREQQLAVEKMKAEERRKQKIQYALLGIGIITFIILFLLLSRSFITNTKLITFFGVVALLIVFEFLNLLLHPLLERVTNHSSLLMLLALVCIAALLVPLHHKLEKWAIRKLVEKNKQVRLAAAKKTIELLDKKT